MNKVLVVLVLYNQKIEDVASILTILRIIDECVINGEGSFYLAELVIFDNSDRVEQNQMTIDSLEGYEHVSYVHSECNAGTSGAYKFALDKSKELHIDWIMTLDQDCDFPQNYVDQLNEIIGSEVGASCYAPCVFHKRSKISPSVVSSMGRITPFNESVDKNEFVSCIASYTLFKASALECLHSIPSKLWLDYVDHWIFMNIFREKGNVVILDIPVQHDLSVKNPNSLSSFRVKSILSAEELFCKNIGFLAVLYFYIRVLIRSLVSLPSGAAYSKNVYSWLSSKMKIL